MCACERMITSERCTSRIFVVPFLLYSCMRSPVVRERRARAVEREREEGQRESVNESSRARAGGAQRTAGQRVLH